MRIYNNKQGKYIHAASADNNAACTLTSEPTLFMLLNRADYEYGVLEMTGHKGSKLTMTDDNGSTLGVAKITTGNPKYFIIFGLSTHKLIYHLAIAKIGYTVEIPYSSSNVPLDPRYDSAKGKLVIQGTTQRDLDNDNYQLGTTIFGKTYSVNAGEVSIGDELKVPSEFERPNCNYFYYVDNIQTTGATVTYQKTADDETAYETARDALSSTGYYYFKIGTSTYTYKRVHVTSTSPSLEYSEVDCTSDDWSNCWQDNDELNTLYKGLKVTKLMSEARLIGGLVQINIGYAFQTGLETNAGEGFVTDLNDNLWYTFETKDGPYLAHYTNAWGLQAMEGRDTRYTNDYLWTPLGDVYGFKMYNRYMIKNSGGVNNVMTTVDISDNRNLKMAVPGVDGIPIGNEVYELLGSNDAGYFRIHPVINYSGTQYYVWKDPDDNYAKLSTDYTEWTFKLTTELLKPYVDRVGYVGGLKETVYTANKAIMDKVKNGTANMADMRAVQEIVYNDANIVQYEPGYYRLHNQPGVSEISPVRYASGYLHDIEKTAVSGGIPMHFYSKAGVKTTFGSSGLKSGYKETHATRGDIPVLATEYDPSTIFYFDGTETLEGNPRSTMQTQGLYVAANPMEDSYNGTTTNRQQRAVMKATENPAEDAITFSLMDIGGAVLLIHDGAKPAQRRYLNFDQSNFFQRTATSLDDAEDESSLDAQAKKFTSMGDYYFKVGDNYYKVSMETVYDSYHDSPTDDAKWCMQPVQKSGTAKTNEMALMVTTNNGGDDYYYTTFCAPFDVLLPANDDKKTYYAYTCDTWNEQNLHPTKVPAVTGTTSYDAGRFVPAGTPVIIRTSDNSGNIQLTLPSTSPHSAESCIFTGKYLEQLLPLDAGNEWTNDVYTLGLPFTSDVHKDTEDYEDTGDITSELPEQAKSGVGFYINANPNKEADALESMWHRNNRYVLHNKIFYREGFSSGSSARGMTRSGVEFVPLIFDWEDVEEDGYGHMEEEELTEHREYVGDGYVYDMQGRRVATEEQVLDGTWKQRVSPGIYIINGKKISVN